jgi:ribosomal protein S18 acetylase RimI-like enzyme
LTVAKELNLTRENAPTNPAFLTMKKLLESIEKNVEFFIACENNKICGCVGIQQGKEEGEYYIERLAVLPAFRHRQYGKKLLDKAIEEIKMRNCKYISIGIINENIRLKKWYLDYGFIEKGTKRFEHLPFTVCFMGIDLK